MNQNLKNRLAKLQKTIHHADNVTHIWCGSADGASDGYEILTGNHDAVIFRMENESIQELKQRALRVDADLRAKESSNTGQTGFTFFFGIEGERYKTLYEKELDQCFTEKTIDPSLIDMNAGI